MTVHLEHPERDDQFERIFTTNHETNVAMRGVNARLGYEPLPERVVVSGPA